MGGRVDVVDSCTRADQVAVLTTCIDAADSWANLDRNRPLETYLDWSQVSADRLRGFLSPKDVHRLVLTDTHLQLAVGSISAAQGGPGGHVGVAAQQEKAAAVARLTAARDGLTAEVEHWATPAIFDIVVFDTSAFIRAPDKLDALDVAATAGRASHEAVRLVVPIAVVDELDGLKRHQDKHVRWRAGHTLGVLYGQLRRQPHDAVMWRDNDFTDTSRLHARVYLEVLFDPPGHLRLPITDDEIVARAADVAAVVPADRRVVLVTADTSMALRGRAAGLHVTHLTEPPEQEPVAPTRGPAAPKG